MMKFQIERLKALVLFSFNHKRHTKKLDVDMQYFNMNLNNYILCVNKICF